MAVFDNIKAAVEELKRDPNRPVYAEVDSLDVELRALVPHARPADIGEFLEDLGPWEGESYEELSRRLREARKEGGSEEPPSL
ncbi:MAG: hypothetical protein ACJ75H_23770 [Thermoanaerobaculia bacterium]